MIYVTHDQIEAMTLADRIAVMKGGIIQQLDTPQTIYNRPVNLLRRRLHRLAGDELPQGQDRRPARSRPRRHRAAGGL